ncbi:MAG: tyrosine-type recombinase/integrase [Desulfotomaculales bacterium]
MYVAYRERQDFVRGFLDWLRADDRAYLTIVAYEGAVRAYLKWRVESGLDPDPTRARPEEIQDYRSYLMGVQRRAPATVNKQLVALRSFYSYLSETAGMASDPTRRVRLWRSQQAPGPRWLPKAERDRLILALAAVRNPWRRARDTAIMLCMLLAGLRVSEVASLRDEAVSLKDACITVYEGKGMKFRVVPIHPELGKALKEWLAVRGEGNGYLFWSQKRKRISARTVQLLAEKYFERAGIKDYTTHSLRHTFCKSLVDCGVPLQDVARLAGHEKLETTRKYVEPSLGELRSAVRKIRI